MAEVPEEGAVVVPLNRKNPDYAPIAVLLDEEKRALLDRVIDQLKEGENFEAGMSRATKGVCPHSTYALLRIALWFWNGGDSTSWRINQLCDEYLAKARLPAGTAGAVADFARWLGNQTGIEGRRLDQRIDNGDVGCLDGHNRDRFLRAMAVALGITIPPLPERCEKCGRVHAEQDAKSTASGGLWTCTGCGWSTNLWSKLCDHACKKTPAPRDGEIQVAQVLKRTEADGGEVSSRRKTRKQPCYYCHRRREPARTQFRGKKWVGVCQECADERGFGRPLADGGEDRAPLDDLIPHKDRNDEDRDLCVACGKDVGARSGPPSPPPLRGSSVVRELDNYALFYTPAGVDNDSIYILAWCSRECIVEWARGLLEKFVGITAQELAVRAAFNKTGETCAHGIEVVKASPLYTFFCPCHEVKAHANQTPVECYSCLEREAGEVGA